MKPTCRGLRDPPASVMRRSWSVREPTCPSSARSQTRTPPAACATLPAPPAGPRLHKGPPVSRSPARLCPFFLSCSSFPGHLSNLQFLDIHEGFTGANLLCVCVVQVLPHLRVVRFQVAHTNTLSVPACLLLRTCGRADGISHNCVCTRIHLMSTRLHVHGQWGCVVHPLKFADDGPSLMGDVLVVQGVLYSHRSNYLHALVTLLPDAAGIGSTTRVLAVVPMFHANAWGIVFGAPLTGCRLVLCGTMATMPFQILPSLLAHIIFLPSILAHISCSCPPHTGMLSSCPP